MRHVRRIHYRDRSGAYQLHVPSAILAAVGWTKGTAIHFEVDADRAVVILRRADPPPDERTRP